MIKLMKLVVGLGNPGKEYQNNRHNAGFMVLDRLARGEQTWESKFDSLIMRKGDSLLVKPQLFMNRSGEAVAKLVNFYKVAVDDLVVIHDDLDIRLREFKIQKRVGPKVHNGVNSIEAVLGKNDFWRVRVGVDNRLAEGRTPGEEYVLADFTMEERESLERTIERIAGELSLLIK